MLLPAKPTVDDIARLGQPNPSSAAIAARAVHLSRMQGFPNAYRNLLPTTDDPKALEAAEAAIRAMHAEDSAQHAAINTPEPQPLDISKLNSVQKIEHGLKTTRPQGLATTPIDPSAFGRAGTAPAPAVAAHAPQQPQKPVAAVRQSSRATAQANILEGISGASNAGSFL